MYIYSTGLANNIKYLLNPDNIIDIMKNPLNWDTAISELDKYVNGRIMFSIGSKPEVYLTVTHKVSTFTFSINITYEEIYLQNGQIDFINTFINTAYDIIKYGKYIKNEYYSTYDDTNVSTLCSYAREWATHNSDFIKDVLKNPSIYKYNTISKLINIFHEFVRFVPDHFQELELDAAIAIYDMIILEQTHPYEYNKYIQNKKFRHVFKEEFMLYGADRVINVLSDIINNPEVLKSIKRYMPPDKMNAIITHSYSSPAATYNEIIHYDLIYSSRYYKFINYYLRQQYLPELEKNELIKPELNLLFQSSYDFKKVTIDESRLIKHMLYKMCNIVCQDSIDYPSVEFSNKYDYVWNQLEIRQELEKIDRGEDNVNLRFRNLDVISSPICIVDYTDLSIQIAEITYNVIIYYINHPKDVQNKTIYGTECFKYGNNWYDENGIKQNRHILESSPSSSRSSSPDPFTPNNISKLMYYKVENDKHYVYINPRFDLKIAYINDYINIKGKWKNSDLAPKKNIQHFHGYEIHKKSRFEMLQYDINTYKKIDYTTVFDKLNKVFIQNFKSYFKPLDQQILLYRIGKFKFDFYKDGDFYKSACYISTSYMTSYTEESPFTSEYDSPNMQDVYIIIANEGVSVCHVHFNSISNENEILINYGVKCTKHAEKFNSKMNRNILYVELSA